MENAGASSQIDASTPDIEKAVGVCVYVCGYYVYPVALLGVAAGCTVWIMWCCITGRRAEWCILA